MIINVKGVIDSIESQRKKPSIKEFDPTEVESLVIRRNEKLEEQFGKLQQDKTYVFATAGRWSQFELLNYILMQTGPADVLLSTWKINMDAAVNLYSLCNKGLIRNLSCILEKRIPVTSPEALELVKLHADRIRITDNHSKVMVVINEHWGISVLGSANMTNNPRIEAGVLFSSKAIADFNAIWMKEVIDERLF